MLVRLRVQPRARQTRFAGQVAGADGTRLRLHLTAPPVDGEANRAACLALASALGVSRGAVAVAQGETAREKTLSVAGDPALLAVRLQALA